MSGVPSLSTQLLKFTCAWSRDVPKVALQASAVIELQVMADSRPSKRRKTLLACEYCRNKKTKCDGERPVCGACAKRSWGPDRCFWKHVDGREDTVPLGLVRDLERRIQELERQGATHPSTMPTSLTPGAAPTSTATASYLPANSPGRLGPSPTISVRWRAP